MNMNRPGENRAELFRTAQTVYLQTRVGRAAELL